MDNEKKSRLFFLQKEKRLRHKNFIIRAFLVVLIAGYGFFFTSSLWGKQDVIQATPYAKVITDHDRDMTLDTWKYDEAQNLMEVQISIQNNAMDGYDKYTYKAIDREHGFLSVDPILETADLVVLQFHVQPSWQSLSVQIYFPDEIADGDFRSFYMNRAAVQSVDKIETLTETGYRIEKYERDITYTEDAIKDAQAEIEDNNERIRTYEQEIQAIQNDLIYQTAREQENSQHLIDTATSNIEQLNRDNTSIEEEIKEDQEKIEMLKKRLNDLEETER